MSHPRLWVCSGLALLALRYAASLIRALRPARPVADAVPSLVGQPRSRALYDATQGLTFTAERVQIADGSAALANPAEAFALRKLALDQLQTNQNRAALNSIRHASVQTENCTWHPEPPASSPPGGRNRERQMMGNTN